MPLLLVEGLLQHAVERAVEADHLQFGVAREDLLHDRAAEGQARQRGELGRVLDGRRVLGQHSRIVRMSRMCTSSSSRFCSTFCSVLSGTHLGHQVLDQLGRDLARCGRAAAAFPGGRAARRRGSGSSGSGAWPPRCRHRPPCSRRSAPARAGRRRSRPRAGRTPGRASACRAACRVTCPGLIASHWFGKASPRPISTPFRVMR